MSAVRHRWRRLSALGLICAGAAALWLLWRLRPWHAPAPPAVAHHAAGAALQPPLPSRNFAEPTQEAVKKLHQLVARLKPLRPPLPPPRAGDWLSEQDELGQLFEDYLESKPIRPTQERHTLYIQPLGPFDPQERRIVEQTAEFIGRYFNLPVRVRPQLPLSAVPQSAFRWREDLQLRQMHTATLLYQVLRPTLPADAAACIALTTLDLYPEPKWNFVFGQSSTFERVGVWSLARNGDPHLGEDAFRQVLVRTIKTATHEIAHMFGVEHCTEHPCNMNGINSLDEADRTPLDPCPECMAKICWLTGIEPASWLRGVAACCHELGLPAEARLFERALHLIEPS